jgi:hypothetical protein
MPVTLPAEVDPVAFVAWLREEAIYLHAAALYAADLGYADRAESMEHQAGLYATIADRIENPPPT